MKHHSPYVRLRCIFTTTFTPADIARDVNVLDAAEQAKQERFVSAEDRRDYAATHALLRRMLTDAETGIPPAAWRFDMAAGGKPVIASTITVDPAIGFSLSHSRGLAVCVVSNEGDVGVDAESQSRNLDVELLMPHVCSVDEQEQIRLLAPSLRTGRFLDHWTLKEAYVKACGTGIDDSLHKISFDLSHPASIAASLPEEKGRYWWWALFQPSPQTHIAVAFTAPSGRPPILDAAIVDAKGSDLAIHANRISA